MRYAIALEKKFSKDEILARLPEHRGLRRPRLRHRVGRAVLLRRQARRRPHARRGGEPHRDREPPREVPPRLPRERDERRRHRRRRPARAVRRQQGAARLHPRRDAEAQEDHAGGVRRRDRDARRPGDHGAEHRMPDGRRQRLLLRLRRPGSSRTSSTTPPRPTSTRVPSCSSRADCRSTRRSTSSCRTEAETAIAENVPYSDPRFDVGSVAVTVQPGTGRILAMAQNKQYSNDPDVARDEPRVHLGELQHRLRVRRLERPPARIDVQGLHPRRVAERGALPHRDASTARDARSRRSPTAAPATGRGSYNPRNDDGRIANNAVDATAWSVNTSFMAMASAARPLQDQADRPGVRRAPRRRRRPADEPVRRARHAGDRARHDGRRVRGHREQRPHLHARSRSTRS